MTTRFPSLRFQSRNKSPLRRWRLGVSAVLLLAASVGCRADDGPKKRAETAGQAPLRVPPLVKTVDSAQIVRSMNAQVAELARLLETRTDAGSQKEFGNRIVAALLERAHFLGAVGDYAKAKQIASELASAHGEQFPELYELKARTLAALHYFDGATVELDRAVASKSVAEADVLITRCSIWLARGEAERAWKALKDPRRRRPPAELVLLAAVALADLGEIVGAESEFRRALSGRSDGAPQPIVRALFHWGRMWERQGKRGRAMELYSIAHKRFPQYAPLASHFAALEAKAGNLARATELLEPVAKSASDPEYKAQLAELLKDSDRDRSSKLLEQARTGYAALIKAEWRAFADHAARFHLRPGQDRALALKLARKNLRNRASDESYQLFLDAAHANADASTETCSHASAATKLSRPSAYLLFAAARTLRGCGESKAADAALARARTAPRAR